MSRYFTVDSHFGVVEGVSNLLVIH